MGSMYIRRARTKSTTTGESYFSHRLVRSERIGVKVRQVTLLNLGRHFPVKQDDWPLLCRRIEGIISGQAAMVKEFVPDSIERAAQRYAGQLVDSKQKNDVNETDGIVGEQKSDFQEVDINSLQQIKPRSIGVESVGLHAMSELGFVDKLTELGVNGVMRAAIIGNVIGRMAKPSSELSTWNWLKNQSALGELLDFDFEAMPHTRLYHASDVLIKHKTAIENHIFSTVQNLFGLDETVTLYDLTNTYFEGDIESNPQAKRGRSKEKRSDCPLVTLGMVLDGSGFVRRSKTFEGNVSEGSTLAEMLAGLGAPAGALVIMDAGIATEANIAWLVEHKYRYLVVRRNGTRQFYQDQSVAIETASGETVRLQKKLSEDGKEVLLYCHSTGREAKETAMFKQSSERYVAGLQHIVDGLQKPRAEKRYDKLLERVGRLKEKSMGAAQHYNLNFTTDESSKIVTDLKWEKAAVDGTKATHPGVYCLRSNELSWDEEKLWRTYTMLTDLESVFRSLKSELGLRPVFHSKEDRADGHLFITVLAYQFVQVLRRKLKAADIHDSWSSLRDTLEVQRRVTACFKVRDGHTLNVRKTTLAEPDLMKIYKALKINSAPGGVRKMIN
jgi:transposase